MHWLSLLYATILGIVEGLTEFIPVSSTGHLILVQDALGLTGRKENAFAIFIQLGAILAVVWLYRQKCYSLVVNWRSAPSSRRLLVNLVVGTLPAVAIGFPTHDWIEAHLFQPIPVAVALIVGGIAILLVERWQKCPSVESMDHIPLQKALGIGVIQVLSILFPGLSRSGATIVGGLSLGLSRTAATEFSFFLAIPAMLGASLVKLIGARDLLTLDDLPVFAVGFIVSFVAALVAIQGLLSFISRNSFAPFAWYRIVFGAGLLGFYCWCWL
jgi:undecaprenyl-diphosphatase